MIFEFKLPDIGEGLAEAEIIEYLVKEGDKVTADQPVVKIENDKALVELPSPVSGTVKQLFYKAGDIAETGSVMMTFETDSAPADAKAETVVNATAEKEAVPSEKTAISAAEVKRESGDRVKATPHTRKLARELKVDINGIPGSGKGGRITDEDVKRFADSGGAAKKAEKTKEVLPSSVPVSAEDEKIPFVSIRRKTAENLHRAWQTIPHVSHMDEADITDLMENLKKISSLPEYKDEKITLLSFVIKIVTNSLKKHAIFNSVLDEENQEIVLKKSYNIGFAVDTDSGLMVPNVKASENKNIVEIARTVRILADQARDRTIDIGNLRNGTFTITNVGSIGGEFATPIILHPQVAILGMMRAKKKPVVLPDDEIAPRLMLPLVVTFDHRLIDGVAAAKFLNSVKEQLENPLTFMLELR